MITISDGQFKLDGVRRPYNQQSWFKWSSYFYAPHRDLGAARASLQRAKALGFDGIRVFDEHHAWNGNEFLSYGAPLNYPWNLHMSTSSSFQLSLAQKKAYARMADMLDEEKMFAELVINTTIKQEPGYLSGRHERMVSYWERMQRVVVQYLNEITADRFVLENCNEFDAHVPAEAYAYLREDRNGVDLVPRMAERAQRDYPGRPYGISRGGTWEIDPAAAEAYTHINVHTPRSGAWWDVADGLKEILAYWPGKPVSANENMHGMSTKQWQRWAVQSPKLQNQSRLDIDSNVSMMCAQWRTAGDLGVSYTLHNANGIFSDPDAPEDGFETAWAVDHDGTPPEPEPRYRYQRIIEQGYQEILGRSPDSNGLEGYDMALRDFYERDGGLSECDFRDSLIRSDEYKRKNPSGAS